MAEQQNDLLLLAEADHLIVKQKVEFLEIFSPFEARNRYEILDGSGQRVMYAVEETEKYLM